VLKLSSTLPNAGLRSALQFGETACRAAMVTPGLIQFSVRTSGAVGQNDSAGLLLLEPTPHQSFSLGATALHRCERSLEVCSVLTRQRIAAHLPSTKSLTTRRDDVGSPHSRRRCVNRRRMGFPALEP
jgi:hypothetical protein